MGGVFLGCTVDSDEDNSTKNENVSSEDFITDLPVFGEDLPVIVIKTDTGEEPTCELVTPSDGSEGFGIANATILSARMVIFKNKEVLYDSGTYNEGEAGITINIRGNSSAWSNKKPYKLKLQKKEDLLFRGNNKYYADKTWLLIKDATTLNTVVGLRTADILGFDWTPKYEFVNVVLNNDYKGIYLLIESIKKKESCVNIDDSGFLIECDTHWWTEDIYFKTDKGRYYTFKHPDITDISDEKYEEIKNKINSIEQVISTDYESILDVQSFAKWLLVHDILSSVDGVGSNIYIGKYDNTSSTKLFMATPWDFDWICSIDRVSQWSAIHSPDYFWYLELINSNNDNFWRTYKGIWNNTNSTLIENITKGFDVIKENEKTINASRKLDSERWDTETRTVEEDMDSMISYFQERIEWLSSVIN